MRRLIAVTIVSRRTRSRLCDLNFALTCNDWINEWEAMSKQLGWWMRLVKLLIETGHQPSPQTIAGRRQFNKLLSLDSIRTSFVLHKCRLERIISMACLINELKEKASAGEMTRVNFWSMENVSFNTRLCLFRHNVIARLVKRSWREGHTRTTVGWNITLFRVTSKWVLCLNRW